MNLAWSLVEGVFSKPDNLKRYGKKSEAKIIRLKVFVLKKRLKSRI